MFSMSNMNICLPNVYFRKFYTEQIFEDILDALEKTDEQVSMIVFDFDELTLVVYFDQPETIDIPIGLHKYHKFFDKIHVNIQSGNVSWTKNKITYTKLIFM